MRWFGLVFILITGFILAGCAVGEETPRLIAAYPNSNPTGVQPFPPQGVVVYTANLEIQVGNVNRAAVKAINITQEHSGYLASSQSWYQDKELHTSLVLAVPVFYFDKVHRALLGLGDLVSERVSGDLKPPMDGAYEWGIFSHITLHLRPKHPITPAYNLPDWRPVKTFSKALQVAGALFGFLLDILIWIVVVAGPFVLAGWILVKLTRRKKEALTDEGNEE